jgi:multidrug efflux pump subunit AcrB
MDNPGPAFDAAAHLMMLLLLGLSLALFVVLAAVAWREKDLIVIPAGAVSICCKAYVLVLRGCKLHGVTMVVWGALLTTTIACSNTVNRIG